MNMANTNGSFQVIGISTDSGFSQNYSNFLDPSRKNVSPNILNRTNKKINSHKKLFNNVKEIDSNTNLSRYLKGQERNELLCSSNLDTSDFLDSVSSYRSLHSNRATSSHLTINESQDIASCSDIERTLINTISPDTLNGCATRDKNKTRIKLQRKMTDESVSILNKSVSIMTRLKNKSGRINEKPKSVLTLSGIQRSDINLDENQGKSSIDMRQSNIDNAEIKKSKKTGNSNNTTLINLAHIKRSLKDRMANTIKSYFSDEVEINDFNGETSSGKDEVNQISLKQQLPNETNALSSSSDDSIKWKFPNSNRKREEKLRGMSKVIKNLDRQTSQINIAQKSSNTDCKNENYNREINNIQEICLKNIECLNKNNSDFKIHSKDSVNTKKSLESLNESNVTDVNNQLKSSAKEILQGMDTQAALVYLSETLIDSAQRAEMLLMQKMKEYNDLVCKDPPERKVKDFNGQVEILDVKTRQDFENRIKEINENHQKEINEKDDKIKELERGRKKLKQFIKRLTGPSIKKVEVEHVKPVDAVVNVEVNEITTQPLESHQEPKKDESNRFNQELLHALQLENRLLRTLVKEMKSELEQENATILSLAKKLEVSLAQQKNKEIDAELVRKLESKLEMQEQVMRQQAIEAKAIARYVIMKYKK